MRLYIRAPFYGYEKILKLCTWKKKVETSILSYTWDRTDNSEHLAQKERAPAVPVLDPWQCGRGTGSILGDDFIFFIS